ncbi:TPA: hypothetical protein ACG0AS_001457 [Enterobacter hormaechei subsp. hoffmannii]|uniref:Uncharacterized protein n=4 Tax=Enterobacter hormaechei TaxID=158836 RepID=A0A431SLR2_9ENTR|nr:MULTISPECIES: hypothetical protein [Enterobacter]ASB75728.1 hypothetical protein AM429_18165 [Enterobacter cloacae complex sp.]AVU20661.1 hypothetical protein AO413_14085 [Enterobacter cloacae]EHF4955296.1 hypothetical protein [Enterobacter hormaechei]EHF4971390.1 hypothetical protein [Enterobacter hormaechei]EHF5011757.1 hypothetical protein [Enterobacter hormaechei]
MDVTEDALLRSGFTQSDVQKIKNNVESYGGTLGEAIQDLANRFRIVLWIFCAFTAMFIWVIISNEIEYVISTGIGLFIAMLIAVFVQPPVLSYKSWRFWRKYRG